MQKFRFSPVLPKTPPFTLGDGLILLGLTALLYVGVRLAFNAPRVISGPDISLSPLALPWYALLSVGRMAAAYFLSLLFSLFYGYVAARNRTARKALMPLLDVLQSVPILSFLPVVLLSLSAILPEDFAAEFAAIVLIFTSQAWNMTFSFYQSMTTIPRELREATSIYRLTPWLRFKTLELPFAAIGLLWNSMMSWSGGWFFLMAAEIFRVGARDFRLPGLGSYLQTAANKGDLTAVLSGVGALVLVIVVLDQFVWRPLVAWTDKFKVEMVEGDEPPASWFLNMLSRSWLVERFGARVWQPFSEWVDSGPQRRLGESIATPEIPPADGRFSWAVRVLRRCTDVGYSVWWLWRGGLVAYASCRGMGAVGPRAIGNVYACEHFAGDCFALDNSGGCRHWYKSPAGDCSSAHCPGGRGHPGHRAFPGTVAGTAASAGRPEHSGDCADADGNAVVSLVQRDSGRGGHPARLAPHHRPATPVLS